MLKGYLIASCMKREEKRMKKKRRKTHQPMYRKRTELIHRHEALHERASDDKTKEYTQTGSRSRMNNSTSLLICSAIAPRCSWWWKFFLGFSLHRTHTFSPPFLFVERPRPRHIVPTGIHANTRHKWWNSAKMKGEHTWWWKNIRWFLPGCSEEVATAIGALFFGGIAVHFANDFSKDFIYIHLVPSWSFNERTIPGLSQG